MVICKVYKEWKSHMGTVYEPNCDMNLKTGDSYDSYELISLYIINGVSQYKIIYFYF